MSKTPEHKGRTISDDKFRIAAKCVDAVLLPRIKLIVDKANQELAAEGIRIQAEIQWGFDEVSPASEGTEK